MAQSVDAASAVLRSLRALYDLGAEVHVEQGAVIERFRQAGVNEFGVAEEPYLLMLGTVLRLLLRHAGSPASLMFEAVAADLAVLDRDIDEAAFDEIAARLRDLDV
jgi:hypothetical protein